MIKTTYNNILIYLAIALATVAVFCQVIHHEFVNFDDGDYVYKNSYVQQGLSRQGITEMLANETKQTGNWHPLTSLSHMLDFELYKLNAGGHHFTSLLFHIANSLLLLFVLNSMTGSFWPSAFVAALFALHPLHVESVAWVSERKDVLSTFFWILTMWAYLSYIKTPTIGRYFLTLVIFMLGLMSKPMLVTLPFVLLLLDYWPLNRFTAWRWSAVWRIVLEKIPFLALSAIVCAIVFIIQRASKAMAIVEEFPLKVRLLNAVVSYVRYIIKTFYPVNLACYYPHPGDTLPLWQPIVCSLVLIVLTAGVIYAARKRRYLVTGWFWYLGTLVPVIGLIQVGKQAMADRYTYVPLIGLFIIIAWWISDICSRLNWRRSILFLCSAIILLTLGTLSWRQAGYWRDSATLFKRVSQVNPNDYYGYERLADAFYRQGRWAEAADRYKELLRIVPGTFSAQVYLADILVQQGKFDEAVAAYRQILPSIPDTHRGLPPGSLINIASGSLAAKSGKLEFIIRLYTFGHYSFGVALSGQGKFEEAVEHFAEVLRFKPDYTDAYTQMALALSKLGRQDEAATVLKEAAKLQTGHETNDHPLPE